MPFMDSRQMRPRVEAFCPRTSASGTTGPAARAAGHDVKCAPPSTVEVADPPNDVAVAVTDRPEFATAVVGVLDNGLGRARPLLAGSARGAAVVGSAHPLRLSPLVILKAQFDDRIVAATGVTTLAASSTATAGLLGQCSAGKGERRDNTTNDPQFRQHEHRVL